MSNVTITIVSLGMAVFVFGLSVYLRVLVLRRQAKENLIETLYEIESRKVQHHKLLQVNALENIETVNDEALDVSTLERCVLEYQEACGMSDNEVVVERARAYARAYVQTL